MMIHCLRKSIFND
uniref:Uncharacterized protein n=1 Tax=Arundo donax TaxID=35708 RepID=A0A0A8ZRZ3_ARUDO